MSVEVLELKHERKLAHTWGVFDGGSKGRGLVEAGFREIIWGFTL